MYGRKSVRSRITSIALALVLALSLAACGASPEEEPAQTPNGEDWGVSYENNGFILNVPLEYADKVIVDMGDDPLFTVTETASREAAQKTHPDNLEGAGLLFAITRITEEELRTLLCGDMSGLQVFARGGDGLYFVLDTPTDVRIERTEKLTQADLDAWSLLNTWARKSAWESFTRDNGLTPDIYSNTELDMHLARIWAGDKGYTLTGLVDGAHAPKDSEGADFAGEILTGTWFQETDEQVPDGEYLVLRARGESSRYDFFLSGDGKLVRESWGDSSILYRSQGDLNVTEIVERWYNALPRQTDEIETTYWAAANALLDEYASLRMEEVWEYDEDAHPEIPEYTAMAANIDRSDLYYGTYDFDDNGVPELVIAVGDEYYKQPVGIYTFDGEKMRYLCREMPLGERCTLSYFENGTFAAQGSGGAAVGSVAIFRIAPDGFSTDLIEIMHYEFQEDGETVYTPELGNMTAEEYMATDYYSGFEVPIAYTLFAQRAQ